MMPEHKPGRQKPLNKQSQFHQPATVQQSPYTPYVSNVRFHQAVFSPRNKSKLFCSRLIENVGFFAPTFSRLGIRASSSALGLSKTFDFIRPFSRLGIRASSSALGLSKTFDFIRPFSRLSIRASSSAFGLSKTLVYQAFNNFFTIQRYEQSMNLNHQGVSHPVRHPLVV